MIELVEGIIAMILAVLTTYFGKKYNKGKKVLKEFSEAVAKVSEAIADDKITRAELQEINKEFQDVYEALMSPE